MNEKSSASKTKFYRTNRDSFLRYFDSLKQYEALILAGNFKKMEEMIKENSVFNFENWAESFLCKKR